MNSTPNRADRFPMTAAGLAGLILLGLPGGAKAQFADAIKAFEDNADYVAPMATLFGSLTNSGWYQSAGVGGLFGFYLGLPISLAGISDDDRSYQGTWTDQGCVLFHEDGDNPAASGPDCPERVSFTAPTLFGRMAAPDNLETLYDPNTNTISGALEHPNHDGIPRLADFNWLPFVMPQLGMNFLHTELKLRYFILPLGDFSFQAFGIGLQHDLDSFLPPLPVSVSVAGNFTRMSAEIKPGDGVDGTLELSGISHFVGLLVGYDLLGMLEVFVEAGWEGATLETGGSLTITDVTPNEEVRPALKVEGRNGFRAALNLSFHFGYQAVVGQNVGANLGNHFNLLGYRLKL